MHRSFCWFCQAAAHMFSFCRENIYADVVLIHGLMGGPFKTWSKEDRRRTEPGFVVDDEVRETYTFCWPKVP